MSLSASNAYLGRTLNNAGRMGLGSGVLAGIDDTKDNPGIYLLSVNPLVLRLLDRNMTLTVEVLAHLHSEHVPVARGNAGNGLQAASIRGAISQNHHILWMNRASLRGSFEDANVLGGGGEESPVESSIWTACDVYIDC